MNYSKISTKTWKNLYQAAKDLYELAVAEVATAHKNGSVANDLLVRNLGNALIEIDKSIKPAPLKAMWEKDQQVYIIGGEEKGLIGKKAKISQPSQFGSPNWTEVIVEDEEDEFRAMLRGGELRDIKFGPPRMPSI